MTIDDVLFDKSYLTISHKAEEKLIHLKWKGFTTSEQYREGLNFALEYVRENQIENWLGNLKMMEIILPADEEWTMKVWNPMITASPIRKMAIVTSLDYLNNAAVKRIVSPYTENSNFETRFFVDVSEARSWLTGAM